MFITSRKAAPTDWPPATIKAALRECGWSLWEVALAHGLPALACARALHTHSLRGEAAIASALEIPAQRIWPSRYMAFDSTARASFHENEGSFVGDIHHGLRRLA